MKTILITMDSLNRHFLSLYGADEVETPTIDNFAKDGVIFESHFTGSAPCMPARRELLTGILEMRHRGWGPLEPFDNTLPKLLQNISCPSMLITDHFHYFEKGGENYHTDFTGYEFIRGLELDNWKTHNVTEPELNPLGRTTDSQERNRAELKSIEDYPVTKTFKKAINWVDENRDTENFFLYMDIFDPHEPFSVPEKYLKEFDDSGYEGPRLEWLKYDHWKGNDRELSHIRNRYKAKLSFIDDLLKEFFIKLKSVGLYEDTTIILTSDHGHLIGEHEFIGKNRTDYYNEIFNIPLVIKPGGSMKINSGKRTTALSTTADIYATICDINGIKTSKEVYGRSLLPILTDPKEKVRSYVLYGQYGNQQGFCDGVYTYQKAPATKENSPLYYYSTRISSLYNLGDFLVEQFKKDKERSIENYIWGVDYPVIRFKMERANPSVPVENISPDVLHDFCTDKAQKKPIRDKEKLDLYRKKLRDAMQMRNFP